MATGTRHGPGLRLARRSVLAWLGATGLSWAAAPFRAKAAGTDAGLTLTGVPASAWQKEPGARIVPDHAFARRLVAHPSNIVHLPGGRLRLTDLAAREGVTDAYVCRLLPLTCLAPELVEAILDGRQPKGFRLAALLRGIPLAWEEQRQRLEPLQRVAGDGKRPYG